ncbi:recombinase family protein [Virgibacillus subterraneus]|uniref:recombinase family protein n=1 Tax=Virgibacillus subterraneus TaxID=621109 RepID=UPI001FE0C749|nr:recombinase family protein [Virgibacillus subterraneus]
MREVLELVKKNQVDTLVVYQRDRLTRSCYKYLEIVDLMNTHKVKVIFTASDDIPFQHDQEDGVLKEFHYALLLEKERNHMSNRIKDALKAKES